MLKTFLKPKVAQMKVGNKIVEYSLQLDAHNGSGFDMWAMSINLPCDRRTEDTIMNGKGKTSFDVSNGYIRIIKKQLPQYLFLRCGWTYLNFS